jgi:site-specific DNA-methyltransferase (adenine-specific)
MYKIYNDDCFSVMKSLIASNTKVDMVFSDLPYGTTNCGWDSVIDLKLMWELIEALKRNKHTPVVLFAQTPFDKVLGASNLKQLKYEWIWEKTRATGHLNAKKAPMKAHENILVFYEKPPVYNYIKTTGHTPVNSFTKTVKTGNNTDVYNKTNKVVVGGGSTERYPRSVLKFASDTQKSKLHPTQKPVALNEYMINTYTNEGDMVLDITAGAFTSGVASINLNRDYIGIEKEKKYYDVGIDRLESCRV